MPDLDEKTEQQEIYWRAYCEPGVSKANTSELTIKGRSNGTGYYGYITYFNDSRHLIYDTDAEVEERGEFHLIQGELPRTLFTFNEGERFIDTNPNKDTRDCSNSTEWHGEMQESGRFTIEETITASEFFDPRYADTMRKTTHKTRQRNGESKATFCTVDGEQISQVFNSGSAGNEHRANAFSFTRVSPTEKIEYQMMDICTTSINHITDRTTGETTYYSTLTLDQSTGSKRTGEADFKERLEEITEWTSDIPDLFGCRVHGQTEFDSNIFSFNGMVHSNTYIEGELTNYRDNWAYSGEFHTSEDPLYDSLGRKRYHGVPKPGETGLFTRNGTVYSHDEFIVIPVPDPMQYVHRFITNGSGTETVKKMAGQKDLIGQVSASSSTTKARQPIKSAPAIHKYGGH